MLDLRDLASVLKEHGDAYDSPVSPVVVNESLVVSDEAPSLMGVINLSTDSWYRESVCVTSEAAIRKAQELAAQGAHIIDIGAESTLPNAEIVAGTEQADRLLPLLNELRSKQLVVSIETYHASVAARCLEAGATVINLTGNRESQEIYELAAKHRATVVLCFVAGKDVRNVQRLAAGNDPFDPIFRYFESELEKARKVGLDKLILDPGLGFYYEGLEDGRGRIQRQIQVFLESFRLRSLGLPICHALPHAFECFGEEVRTAESFFAVMASLGRTNLFRTHEIPKVRAVLETMNCA